MQITKHNIGLSLITSIGIMPMKSVISSLTLGNNQLAESKAVKIREEAKDKEHNMHELIKSFILTYYI